MINVYDPITNEQLEFIEDKPKGMRLYKTATGDLITCMPESVTIFPSARRIRTPVPFREKLERPKAAPKPDPAAATKVPYSLAGGGGAFFVPRGPIHG